MEGKIIYNEQEQTGNYTFLGTDKYMTANFLNTFGEELATEIYAKALEMVEQEHFEDADYFQTFVYQYPDGKEVRFWIILDERENASNILTALLPEDY